MVKGTGNKAKRLVLQCINNELKSCRGKNKNLTAQRPDSNTVWFNLQTYIYIYILQRHAKNKHYDYKDMLSKALSLQNYYNEV